jgi:hypothetical protein
MLTVTLPLTCLMLFAVAALSRTVLPRLAGIHERYVDIFVSCHSPSKRNRIAISVGYFSLDDDLADFRIFIYIAGEIIKSHVPEAPWRLRNRNVPES